MLVAEAAVHALSKCVRSLMAVNVLCFMLGHSAVRRHRPRVSRMQQTIRDLSGQTRQDKTRQVFFMLFGAAVFIVIGLPERLFHIGSYKLTTSSRLCKVLVVFVCIKKQQRGSSESI